MKHKHRIKPGYEGGKYEEGNVVVLSVTQHAMWHFAEWQRKGNWEDKLAWQALAGIVGREEITQTLLSEAGKKGGKSIVRDEEFRQKISRANTGKTRTPEQKQQMSERLLGHKRWTEEAKEKNRQSNLGQRRSAKAREAMRNADRDLTNVGAHLRLIPNSTRRSNARKGVLKTHGWNGTHSEAAEYRTSLSETFVEYYAEYGRP